MLRRARNSTSFFTLNDAAFHEARNASDVLKFFKNTGARYQSRINAVLREYVNAHRDVA
jgi:uncharacterized protein (DUF4415 family)